MQMFIVVCFFYRFMFKGDGKAFPISTQPSNAHAMSIGDSFDSGVVPLYPESSSSSLHHQSPSNSNTDLKSFDSGLPPSYPTRTSFHQQSVSPHGVHHHTEQSKSPYSRQQPPPVNLNSHPNRQKSLYESIDLDSGSTMTEMTDAEQFFLDTHDEPYNGSLMKSDFDSSLTVKRYPTFCIAKNTSQTRHQTVPSLQPSSLHLSDNDQYVQMNSAPTGFRSTSDCHGDRNPHHNTTSRKESYIPKYENVQASKADL